MNSRRAVLQGVIRFWCGHAWGWWQAQHGPMSGRMCSGFGAVNSATRDLCAGAQPNASFPMPKPAIPPSPVWKNNHPACIHKHLAFSLVFSFNIKRRFKVQPWSLLFLPSFDPKPLSIHHALKSSQGYPWAWVEPTQRRNNSTLFDWNNGDASAEDGRAWIFSNVGAYMPIGWHLADLF